MLKLSKAYAAYERKVTLQRTVMHRSLCHAVAWQSTYRLAGLDKLTIPRLSLETASNPKAAFLMCRGGRSADTSLATDILSVKAVPVDFGTFTPIQDGKQPNAGKCESHRE